MSRQQLQRQDKLRSWYLWHRWLGVSAAWLVLMLAATGLMLNHTEALKLDHYLVTSEAILNWYGIRGPGQVTSYAMGGHRLTQAGSRLYLDAQPLPGAYGPLQGAVVLDGRVVAVVDGELVLLTSEGALIERLGRAHGVPPGARRIGRADDGRLVISAAGGYFAVDQNLLRWTALERIPSIRWSEPSVPPAALRKRIVEHYRGSHLTLERLTLDLHSGRILGQGGSYVMDAAAGAMLLLAGSGVWLWTRGMLHRRQRRHGKG